MQGGDALGQKSSPGSLMQGGRQVGCWSLGPCPRRADRLTTATMFLQKSDTEGSRSCSITLTLQF